MAHLELVTCLAEVCRQLQATAMTEPSGSNDPRRDGSIGVAILIFSKVIILEDKLLPSCKRQLMAAVVCHMVRKPLYLPSSIEHVMTELYKTVLTVWTYTLANLVCMVVHRRPDLLPCS